MKSSEPVTIAAITAAAAVASAAGGIYSATKTPDTPDEPKAGLAPGALTAQRRQRAAATGRSSTILTGSKLGTIGGQ